MKKESIICASPALAMTATWLMLMLFVLLSGCSTMLPDGRTDFEVIPLRAMVDFPLVDVMEDERRIYYKKMDDSYKCLVRIKPGPRYAITGQSTRELFICLLRNQQDGYWDIVRFTDPHGPKETTEYRYSTEEAAYRAVLPLIYK